MPANGGYLLRKSTGSYRYDEWGTDTDKTNSRSTNTDGKQETHTGNTTDNTVNRYGT